MNAIAAFRAAQLHDYNTAATRYWLALSAAGALALTGAFLLLLQRDPAELWQIAGWSALVGLAAAFPIPIPRSKHSIATGDCVTFLLLALHGMPAAVVAAGLEGWIGALRSSKRLTSRVASLTAAAAAMTF